MDATSQTFNILRNGEPIPQNKKFSILHAGSLNKSAVWGRSLEGFFQAIQKILLEFPEIKENLVLNFAGDFPDEYRKLVEEMGISSLIQRLGHIPHEEVLRLTQASDLLLALNYDGWATLIPGKIYEYWAVGGPPILLLSCPGRCHRIYISTQSGLFRRSFVMLMVSKRKSLKYFVKVKRIRL